jgi:hypothetical protein
VKQEFSCPFALDCLCNCCGMISQMVQSGAYIKLYIINILFSVFSLVILSCTVPLSSVVRPPAILFKVVFWIGAG